MITIDIIIEKKSRRIGRRIQQLNRTRLLVVDALGGSEELPVSLELVGGVEELQAHGGPAGGPGVPVVVRGDRNYRP